MATKAFLEQAYLAYFGRPIDLNGVAAFANSTQTEVENAFWASPESQALYGTSMGLTQINQVYNMLFGRDAEPAGLAYWANQLVIGAFTPAGAAIAILNGARNDDITAVNNKLAASAMFTAGLDTTAEILGYSGNGAAAVARNFLSSITLTPATQAQVDAAISASVAVGSVTGGQTFTLTTSATDVIVGTAGNDTIIGDWNTGGGNGTIQASDQINGGDGVDTLKLYSFAGAANTLPVSIKNVEIFQYLAPANADINVSAQTINTLAVTQADNLAGKTLTTAATTGLALNTAVKAAGGIKWDAGAATSGNLALNGFTGATGAAGAGDLTLVGPVATLNIQTTAGANATSIAGAALKTINITGGGDLNLGALAPAVTKVDGSSATGSLKMAANAVITTLNTGSGNDVVDYSAAGAVVLASNLGAGNDVAKFGAAGLGAIAAGSLVDGGAGSNIVNIGAGAQLTAANVAKIANFSTLDISGSTGGAYDTTVGGFTAFQADHNVNGAIAAPATLGNVASGFTFTDIGAKGVNQVDAGLTFALKADGKADVANLNVVATDGNNDGVANGNVTITTLNVTQFETLNLGGNVANPDTGVAPAKYVQTISTLTAPDLTALNFSGNEAWVVTNAASVTKLATLNASANTGGVTYNAGTDAVALSITGGSGVDTFTAGTKGTTIYAAGGNDVLTLTGGVTDVLVYKGAGDVTVNTNLTFVDTAAGKIETANAFQTTVAAALAHDTVDISNIGGFAGYAKGTASVTFANANSIGSSVANLFVDAGGQRGTAAYSDGADTYLFVDANHDGNFSAAADMIIKLTGVTTLTASDINFG